MKRPALICSTALLGLIACVFGILSWTDSEPIDAVVELAAGIHLLAAASLF